MVPQIVAARRVTELNLQSGLRIRQPRRRDQTVIGRNEIGRNEKASRAGRILRSDLGRLIRLGVERKEWKRGRLRTGTLFPFRLSFSACNGNG